MQFPGLDMVLICPALKHRLMSPAGLARVSLCMYGMVHLQREGKGRALWAQVPFTRGRWRYNGMLSTDTDHRPFKGLSPESSPVKGNFWCVWCHLDLNGKLRPLNFQAAPFPAWKVSLASEHQRKSHPMTQLQNSWSSAAGSKAQQRGPTSHRPS